MDDIVPKEKIPSRLFTIAIVFLLLATILTILVSKNLPYETDVTYLELRKLLTLMFEISFVLIGLIILSQRYNEGLMLVVYGMAGVFFLDLARTVLGSALPIGSAFATDDFNYGLFILGRLLFGILLVASSFAGFSYKILNKFNKKTLALHLLTLLVVLGIFSFFIYIFPHNIVINGSKTLLTQVLNWLILGLFIVAFIKFLLNYVHLRQRIYFWLIIAVIFLVLSGFFGLVWQTWYDLFFDMHLLTTLCFLIILVFWLTLDVSKETKKVYSTSLVFLLTILLATSAIWYINRLLLEREQSETQRNLQMLKSQIEFRMTSTFDRISGSLYSLKSFYENSEEVTDAEFDHFTASIFPKIASYQSIQFINNEYIVARTYPLIANEVGVDISDDPVLFKAAQQARQTAGIVASEIVHDGKTRQMYFLLAVQKDSVIGFACCHFNVDSFLNNLIAPQLGDNFHLSIKSAMGLPLLNLPGSASNKLSVGENLESPLVNWHIYLQYHKPSFDPLTLTRFIIFLTGNFTVLLFIAFLTYTQQKGIVLEQTNLKLQQASSKLSQLNRTLENRVTERTQMLQHTTNLLNSILDSSTLYAIIATDLKGNILTFNEGARRIYGYPPEEIIGKNFRQLLTKEEIASGKIKDVLRITYREGRFVGESDRIKKGGEVFPAEVTVTPRRNENGRVIGFVNISRDITEKKKLEARLKEYTFRLEKMVKELGEVNRLKSEFLANMSHELKTPLTAIIGYTELLMEMSRTQGELPDKYEDYLQKIVTNGDYLLTLINQILDLTKLESGKWQTFPEEFDLQAVINSSIETVQPFIEEKKLQLLKELPSEPVTLKTDKQKLKEVIINLLSNAIKFTEKGHIKIAAHSSDSRVTISIIDTGIGVRDEHQKIIFDKFSQVDGSSTRPYKGTGLGLYIVKQLVNLLKGQITLTSAFGQGSTFTLTIPKRIPTLARRTNQPISSEISPQEGKSSPQEDRVSPKEDNVSPQEDKQ